MNFVQVNPVSMGGGICGGRQKALPAADENNKRKANPHTPCPQPGIRPPQSGGDVTANVPQLDTPPKHTYTCVAPAWACAPCQKKSRMPGQIVHR